MKHAVVKQTEYLEKQLRRAIKDSGLTIYRLAKDSGVSQAVLSRFVNGKRGITLTTASKLAKKLNLELKFKKELDRALKHVSNKPFGIEIDCDAIENITTSAMTPSGFSVNKTRTFVNYFGKHENACYLHICEAIANPTNEKQIGKLITYLITDFIKANNS